MEIREMRKKIANAPKYRNSMRWQNRVRKMSERQVYAVYEEFKKRGMFDKKKDRKSEYKQLTIFDFFGEDIINDCDKRE